MSIDKDLLSSLHALAAPETDYFVLRDGLRLPHQIVMTIDDPDSAESVLYQFRLVIPEDSLIANTDLRIDEYVYLSEGKLTSKQVALLYTNASVGIDQSLNELAEARLRGLGDAFRKMYGDVSIERLREIIMDSDATFVLSDYAIAAVCCQSLAKRISMSCRMPNLSESLWLIHGSGNDNIFWWGDSYENAPEPLISDVPDGEFISVVRNAASHDATELSSYGFLGSGLGCPEIVFPTEKEVAVLRSRGLPIYNHSYFVIGFWPQGWSNRPVDQQFELDYLLEHRQMVGANWIGGPNSTASIRLVIEVPVKILNSK